MTLLDDRGEKDLLRLITCGSVDDGKSTLIGRLLYDTQLVYSDTLEQLEQDSKRHGTRGGDVDFALLVDGLAAEREQGITIDVAYRFFATKRREFIVADTPGHEQYTRNMATGASTADLALILVDATKGVLTQTKRHSFIVKLLGIKRVVLVINKLDLVGYSQEVFEAIRQAYDTFSTELSLKNVNYIPISALLGDNLTLRSENLSWYKGPTLLEYLETVLVGDDNDELPFRMPIQNVFRPNSNFRGFAGAIFQGKIKPKDSLLILPSMQRATVKEIVTADGNLSEASSGQSVVLTLEEERDISRGDLLVATDNPPQIADRFRATLVWMSDQEMLPGRPYLLKIGTRVVPVSFESPRYEVNINTLEHLAARTLGLNSIGVCHGALGSAVALEPYTKSRELGGFIVIDRVTLETLAAGMIDFGLRRSDNIHHQDFEVTRDARARLFRHKSAVVWFTGLSGAGKSTIANLLERKLYLHGIHTYVLDGDNVRSGLNKDLGFTDADRVENIRRVAEVSKLMVDAGLLVLVSFISPFRAERELARGMLAEGDFIEVFVDLALNVAEARDPKGLYKKARAGQLPHFTGIDSPYETPESPDIHINSESLAPETAAEQIFQVLLDKGIIT